MTVDVRERLDRRDENLVVLEIPTHVIVKDDMRGLLNLKRDVSQHRRYTSFYSDLQN